jgi:phosphocarrier protein HPr
MSEDAVATRTFEIVNVKGLHARAAAKFVEVVEAHDATATSRKDGLSPPATASWGF